MCHCCASVNDCARTHVLAYEYVYVHACVGACVRITSSSTAIITTAETARHSFQLGPTVILCLHIHGRLSNDD